ncbi:MAG: hypothetical protein ACOX45_01020 [Acutalibacteraceae bacterium]
MKKSFRIVLTSCLVLCIGACVVLTAYADDNYYIEMEYSGSCNSARAIATTKGTLWDTASILPSNGSYGYANVRLYYENSDHIEGSKFEDEYITNVNASFYYNAQVEVTKYRTGGYHDFHSSHFVASYINEVQHNRDFKELLNSSYGY